MGGAEMKLKTAIVLLSLCISVTACSYVLAGEPYQKSNLTFGMIKKHIIKGETSQAEILNLFGAPNITTKNKSGEEVWTYDKIAVSKSDKAGGLGVGLGNASGGTVVGGMAGAGGSSSSTSSRSMTLIITYGEKDIVKDYAVMAQEF